MSTNSQTVNTDNNVNNDIKTCSKDNIDNSISSGSKKLKLDVKSIKPFYPKSLLNKE